MSLYTKYITKVDIIVSRSTIRFHPALYTIIYLLLDCRDITLFAYNFDKFRNWRDPLSSLLFLFCRYFSLVTVLNRCSIVRQTKYFLFCFSLRRQRCRAVFYFVNYAFRELQLSKYRNFVLPYFLQNT